MADTVRRKTTIRTAEALRAAMAAFGVAEGDEHGTALAVSEGGEAASLTSARLPGSCGCDDPAPVVFDLRAAAVTYPPASDAAVCELLAWAMAEQVREVARRHGHAFSVAEEVARGRGVLRAVVEQPPRRLVIDLDRGGREVCVSSQGPGSPREGRAFARPYEDIFC